MNIILYSHSFLPKIGGRELVVHYLAKALNELGHNVRVLGPSGWKFHDKKQLGYSVHRYPRLIGAHLTSQSLAARIREKEYLVKFLIDTTIWKCDIVHAHTTYPTGYIASQAKKLGKKFPLVITPHGDDIHTIPEIGHGMRLNPKLKPKIDIALEAAVAITAISDSIQSSVLDTGVNDDKVFNVPNGVDIERYSNKIQTNVFEKLNIPASSKLLVSVGNYHVRKGQAVIIKAMPEILKEDPSVKLVIIGKGSDALLPLINDLNLSEHVILTGVIAFPAYNNSGDEDLLAAIYQNSKIYISAGIEEGSEGLSLAVLEAMAAGLPIVATDISGNREIVFDSINGHLCKPASPFEIANSVNKIIDKKNTLEMMSAESLKIANKYSWIEIAKQYVEVYESVIYAS